MTRSILSKSRCDGWSNYDMREELEIEEAELMGFPSIIGLVLEGAEVRLRVLRSNLI